MPSGVLYPEDVGAADAARVLAFVNAVPTAAALADTVGFGEGPGVGRLVADAILAQRAAAGNFASLADLDAVAGVTPARFTEIVAALSGARPPRTLAGTPGATIRIRPGRGLLWFGQSVGVTMQLLDAAGRGVPGVAVTCLATWGAIASRQGADRQRGASAVLTTGPGGVASFELGPALDPPLEPRERAALEAELAALPADRTAAAAAPLAGFAARYRAEGSAALRGAVDRLLAAMPAEAAAGPGAWPLLPVTLIALAGTEATGDALDRADIVAVATIRLRGWLGPWLAALRDAVLGSDHIGAALARLPLETLKGPEIARGVLGASRAFAGLERGAAARAFRDAATSEAVTRFVSQSAGQVDAAALTDVVRASGASSAAIASGGFAVFDAIETVQQVRGSVAGRLDLADLRGLDGRIGQLEGRVGRVEADRVDVRALDALRSELLARDATLEAAIATRADAAQVDGRFAALQQGLDGLATGRVTAADLAALETRLNASVQGSLGGIPALSPGCRRSRRRSRRSTPTGSAGPTWHGSRRASTSAWTPRSARRSAGCAASSGRGSTARPTRPSSAGCRGRSADLPATTGG